MPKNYRQRAHKVSLKDQKRKKKIVDKQRFGIIIWKPRPQVLTTLPQSLRWKVEFFFAQCPKKRKKIEHFFFLKLILWTVRMKIWQHCQKFSAIKPKLLFHAKKCSKKQFSGDKADFLQTMPIDRRTQFWQPCWTFKTIDAYSSSQCPKMKKRGKCFRIDISLRMIL